MRSSLSIPLYMVVTVLLATSSTVSAFVPATAVPRMSHARQPIQAMVVKSTTSAKASSSTTTTSGKKEKEETVSMTMEFPPPPKRPVGAYILFVKDNFKELHQPGKPVGDVTREVAKLWRELPSHEKEQYSNRAKVMKEEYEALKKKWEKTCDEISAKAGHSAGPVTQSVRTKRTAFGLFCGKMRSDIRKKYDTLEETNQELSRLWKELDKKDRSLYQKMAREVNNKKQQSKTGKIRRKSGFDLFRAEHAKALKDSDGKQLSGRDIIKQLAEMWNKCDDATKQTYADKALKLHEATVAAAAAA